MTDPERTPEEPSVTQAFKNGLLKIGHTFEDIKTWQYCGQNSCPIFKKFFPGQDRPKFKQECVCGNELIVNNGYIRKDKNATIPSEDTGVFLIVGVCCVRHFYGGLFRICDSCGLKHKSRYETEGNTCCRCRKKEDKLIKIAKKQNKQIFDGVIREVLWNGTFAIRNPKIREKKNKEKAIAEQIAIEARKIYVDIKIVMDKCKISFSDAISETKKRGFKYDGDKKLWWKFRNA